MAAKFKRASCEKSGQASVRSNSSKKISAAWVAIDGRLEDEKDVFFLVKEYGVSFIAITEDDFDLWLGDL